MRGAVGGLQHTPAKPNTANGAELLRLDKTNLVGGSLLISETTGNGVATFGGEGSYSTLSACINMELSAARANRSRQFQR
jgi:hypothetical protein